MMLLHLECIENPEAIKQPAVYSDISLFYFDRLVEEKNEDIFY
jgi:hypothetical protein